MTYIEWGIVAVILLIFGLAGYAFYSGSTAEKYYLNVNEWSCTKYKTDYINFPQQVGNVTVQQQIPSKVCVRYER